MVSMRAKRCMWLLGGLVALCVCAAWLYQSAYPIAPDRSNAAECIQDFYLHGSTAEPPVVKLYDAVTLGDRTYVLLELGENLDLGRAILERSLTGRGSAMAAGASGMRSWKQTGGNTCCWEEETPESRSPAPRSHWTGPPIRQRSHVSPVSWSARRWTAGQRPAIWIWKP